MFPFGAAEKLSSWVCGERGNEHDTFYRGAEPWLPIWALAFLFLVVEVRLEVWALTKGLGVRTKGLWLGA